MTNTTYDALVSDVAAYLAGVMRPGIDPEHYARQIIASAEIVDDELRAEIPGRATVTGNPISVAFDAAAYANETRADIAAHAE